MTKILITGGCGFVGANLALFLKSKNFHINTLDNLSRKGSKYNSKLLEKKKIKNFKIDIANSSKFLKLPKYDLIIDCCAEAAVEVSKKKINKVFDTNLVGTLNVLNKVNKDNSKMIYLSSSRVYPLKDVNNLIQNKNIKSKLSIKKKFDENSNILGPKTVYGFTKLASEMLIQEFAFLFNIKFIINRCGVISGPLQFGKQDQGFVSLWIWNHLIKKNMKYIGYGGHGNQIRDVLHIKDLCNLIFIQIKKINKINNKIFTVGGSNKSYTSLVMLTELCEKITNNKIKFKKIMKTSKYDIPYYISNNKIITKTYNWRPKKTMKEIVEDIYIWLLKNKSKIKKYI